MKLAEKQTSQSVVVPKAAAKPTQDDIVIKYLPLVRLLAEKIHRRLPLGVDLESLINSGVVGLLEVVDRYDPKRGVEFKVFARYRIQGEIMQHLRSLDWVSRSVRSWGRKMEAARAKLVGQLVREPTAEEMATELKISLQTYFRLDQQVNGATLVSLDDLSFASEADWETTQQKYTQNSFLDPLSFVEGKDLLEKLTAAVEVLPERERSVITLYYHGEMTLRQIGGILGLSEARICQIFHQGVGRLRNALGATVNSKESNQTGGTVATNSVSTTFTRPNDGTIALSEPRAGVGVGDPVASPASRTFNAESILSVDLNQGLTVV
jgi:RNA polymerase sigma factor for flagellar operon FliA